MSEDLKFEGSNIVIVFCDCKVDKVFSTLESADEYVEIQRDYDKYTFKEFGVFEDEEHVDNTHDSVYIVFMNDKIHKLYSSLEGAEEYLSVIERDGETFRIEEFDIFD